MVRVNLLSLDGGGIRGLIPLHILNELSKEVDLRATFDAMAGTSTGAIIATGLSLFEGTSSQNGKFKYSANDLVKLFEEQAWEIFSRKSWGWLQSKYRHQGLEAVLKRYFGETTLGNCQIPLVIPTYNLANYQPVFFKTRYVDDALSAQTERASRWQLWEILRATSAAPTYFPLFEKAGMKLIDGGIHVNNPALSLLTEIVGNPQYYGLPLPDRTGKTPEETQAGPLQINLLSLGTGRSTEANFAPSFGGALAYAKKAIDISMFGNLQLVDYNLNQLRTRENPNVLNFEFNYLRLSPDITDHRYGDLDSVSTDSFAYYRKVVAAYFQNMSPSLRQELQTFMLQMIGGEGEKM